MLRRTGWAWNAELTPSGSLNLTELFFQLSVYFLGVHYLELLFHCICDLGKCSVVVVVVFHEIGNLVANLCFLE